jgi:hypothetical protein
MTAARWALLLSLAVALGACERDNPAYRGLQDDAGTSADAAAGEDGRARADGATADAGPAGCVPTTLACLGNVLLRCKEDGTWKPEEECPSLCVASGTTAHCGGFLPSNSLPKCGHVDTTLLPFVAAVGGPVVFDTDTFTIGQPTGASTWGATVTVAQTEGPEIAVFKFDSFHVPAGAVVVAQGSRALAIWVQGDVVVAGALRVGGTVVTALPVVRTPPGAWTPQASWSGGAGGLGAGAGGFGGGGYGAAGGKGGPGYDANATGGAAGKTYGSEDLVPLAGGSPGGGILADHVLTSGGGALQIVACRSFALREGGVVSANGQGGPGGTIVLDAGNNFAVGGDGGGSGGAILVESPRMYLAAAITANGGGGGGGAGQATGSTHGTRGEDGREDDVAAAGGEPAANNAGQGGGGGALSVAEGGSGGGVTAQGLFSGGGGGGGVGRIRLNVTEIDRPDLGIIDAPGNLISPTPSKGTAPIW